MAATFYFATEGEECLYNRKKMVSVNSMGHDLDASFL